MSDSSNTQLNINQNLTKELNYLTTTTLHSPTNSLSSLSCNDYHSFQQVSYPSITVPAGIAKLIPLDKTKVRSPRQPPYLLTLT